MLALPSSLLIHLDVKSTSSDARQHYSFISFALTIAPLHQHVLSWWSVYSSISVSVFYLSPSLSQASVLTLVHQHQRVPFWSIIILHISAFWCLQWHQCLYLAYFPLNPHYVQQLWQHEHVSAVTRAERLYYSLWESCNARFHRNIPESHSIQRWL